MPCGSRRLDIRCNKTMKTAIYKITNTANEKLYIGITDRPAARWNDHLRYAKKGKRNKLYNAMRKYGVDAFSMHILYWCDTRDDAYELEQFVVDVVESRAKGYNTTPGGRGLGSGAQHPHYGKKRPPETIEKMRLAHIGVKRPQHEKDKIAATLKQMLALNPRPAPSAETRKKIGEAGLGREVTAETRAKISASTKGVPKKPHTEATKKKLSAIFTGAKHTPEAVEKIRKASTGRKYPNRKSQSAESRGKANASIKESWRKRAKSVLCVQKDTVYPNARAAAKDCGVSEALVSMHCNGKIGKGKSRSGLTFRYAK